MNLPRRSGPGAGSRRHRVVAVLIPSVVAFDLSIPAQIFGHRDEHPRYAFTTCSLVPGPVPTSTGFDVVATHGLDAVDEADTVVVPGFHPLDGVDERILDALRQSVDRGARMASVCVGAFALAAAGVLDGHRATTHWEYAEEFERRFPEVDVLPDVLYVDNGQVLTSAGISAGIDLCLHLVRQDHGQAAAEEVARRMVVPAHRTGGQAQYVRRPMPPDGGLGPTRDWAIERLAQPLTVRHLARHADVPVRSFTRQFHDETGLSPMRWLNRERVREAQRLLEATELSVEDIAQFSGFGAAATLRVHFARELQTTPTAYRQARTGSLDAAGKHPGDGTGRNDATAGPRTHREARRTR